MTMADASQISVRPRGWLRSSVGVLVRYGLLVVLCLTPATAVVALGWLTRKTAADIGWRLSGAGRTGWPNLVIGENAAASTWLQRWFGALAANLMAGLKAWLAVLLMTVPFALVWLTGWFAGWENSFNKGYENAGIWPGVSLLSVLLSVPIHVLLPMAIAHQARIGTVTAILDVGRIIRLVRAAGFSYLLLTALIAIGSVGVLGVRGITVFAEHIAPEVASGSAEAIGQFARRFAVTATALLVIGLIVVRHVVARIYAHAAGRLSSGERGGLIKTAIVLAMCAAIWLGLIFLVYFAQFLNYAWWSWLNQPVLMLPWLAV